MISLATDPTAAALLAEVPCYPVPPAGQSPAIDALRNARAGQGLAIGADGVMLILRRPWLDLDVKVTATPAAYLPYGHIGGERAELRCGLIPHDLLARILTHFEAALPNEAAAFVAWHEPSGDFDLIFPAIDAATSSQVVYRTPILPADWHLICDVHSHGAAGAFFSATDDADDAHATKIAMVIGRVGGAGGPSVVSRLCAAGMFLPLPRSPFAGDSHAV